MNTTRLKKLLILNTPYVVIGLYATKLGEAWRLAEGTDASNKFLHLMDGLSAAFRSPFPSLYPADLLIGCGWRSMKRAAMPRSTGTTWNMAQPDGARIRISHRLLIQTPGIT